MRDHCYGFVGEKYLSSQLAVPLLVDATFGDAEQKFDRIKLEGGESGIALHKSLNNFGLTLSLR